MSAQAMNGATSRRRLLLVLGAAFVVFAAGKLSRAVRVAWSGTGKPADRLGRMSPDISHEWHHWWSVSTARPDLLVGFVALLLMMVVVAYRRAGRQTERIGEEHGSAAWGTKRDFAPYAPRKGEGSVIYTATERLSTNAVRTHRNLNSLVIGSSGSRKTRSYVLPNLLNPEAGSSFGVTDPKFEVHGMAASKLEAAGYDVRALNLVDLSQSGGYNPLMYLDPDQPLVGIAELVNTIVSNTEGSGNRSGSDAFWDRAEKALLTSLVAYVYYAPELELAEEELHDEAEDPTLVQVMDLTKELEASEQDEGFRSGMDVRMGHVRELLANWADLPDMTKKESDAVRDGLQFAAAQYRIFEQGAGETKKGVIISVGVRLALLDMPDVRRILSHDTLRIDRLGYEKGAIFCVIPDTHTAFRFITALFWQTMFSTNIYRADHEKSRTLPVPIRFYLDEFANIGIIPNFEKIIATIRSRGISASVIIQDISQLKSMFEKSWETIVGNCDSMLFLGGTEESTLTWISKRLGPATIKVEDTSQSFGGQGGYSRSLKSQRRDLLTAPEVGELDEDMCIYMVRGCKPFLSKKAPIYTD